MDGLKVEYLPTKNLVPFALNAKLHEPEQVSALVRSINEFGFCNPVLLGEGNSIVAGHGRVLAAAECGLETVPCISLGHLTPEQQRLYRLADNRLGEIGTGWDAQKLKAEVDALAALNCDISLTGWDDESLRKVIHEWERDHAGDEPEPSPDVNGAKVLAGKWKTASGQLWVLGKHRLLVGDSTCEGDVKRLLNGATPHLMTTDPPYGVDYRPGWRDGHMKGKFGAKARVGEAVPNDDRCDWTAAWNLFPGDVAYVWHACMRQTEVEASLLTSGFEIRSKIIWVKQHFTLGRSDYHWQHEPCLYAVRKGKPSHWCGDRTQSSVWQIASLNPAGRTEERFDHGTQKPIEAMARPIRNNSVAGDSVYDPFVGSGTTIIACERLGRICCAVDIDPGYAAVSLQRWADETGGEPKLEG